MCALDDAEIFAIYETWQRKARKPHACDGCGREIARGEEYQFAKGLMPGDGWWKEKLCQHCLVGARWLVQECGGYCMHQSAQEVVDHAAEYKSLPLYRLAVGHNRKWHRFDGAGLMAVPAMPPLMDKGAA